MICTTLGTITLGDGKCQGLTGWHRRTGCGQVSQPLVSGQPAIRTTCYHTERIPTCDNNCSFLFSQPSLKLGNDGKAKGGCHNNQIFNHDISNQNLSIYFFPIASVSSCLKKVCHVYLWPSLYCKALPNKLDGFILRNVPTQVAGHPCCPSVTQHSALRCNQAHECHEQAQTYWSLWGNLEFTSHCQECNNPR